MITMTMPARVCNGSNGHKPFAVSLGVFISFRIASVKGGDGSRTRGPVPQAGMCDRATADRVRDRLPNRLQRLAL